MLNGFVVALLIVAPIATAFFSAASLGLDSVVSTVLAAYLAAVANLGLTTWLLSPVRAVDRTGLVAVEAVLLIGSAGIWLRRGRPLPGGPDLEVARRILADPVVAVFLAVVAALLAYELVLVFATPADNWDSLTYHLTRVAEWMQHGGVYRIPNAATPRMNEYQPFAEQQIFYLFTATKSGALYAVPQYVAQLATMVAIFGSSLRLGFRPRAAICAALLFPMLSLVALQASTSQNDLVAASFPIVALYFLLGSSRKLEPLLAGIAIGLGLGAKLTIVLVVPVLIVFALARGRHVVVWALTGVAAGFAGVGAWGYAINLWNTGHLLGYLGTHIDVPAYEEPLHQSSYATTVDVVYQTLDLSLFSDSLIRWLWIAGIAAGLAVGLLALRRRRRWSALLLGIVVATPFFAADLNVHLGDAIASLSKDWGFPVRGPGGNVGGLGRSVETAAFGPIGAVAFLGTPLIVLAAFALRRARWQHLVLAATVPLFYVLLGHETYNFFMTRFLLVPAALVAPLFAFFLSSRAAAAAFLAVAAASVGMNVTRDPLRPLDGRNGFGRPWQLTQSQVAYLTDETGVGAAVTTYQKVVPPRACVGVLIGSNEPGYFLFGPRLEHEVVYLSPTNALADAYRHSLYYVVISPTGNNEAVSSFRQSGWRLRSLGGYWLLAVATHAGDARCTG
ncbi:MAG TPA: glycosyltransferase 87 family protein [Gaiellaceae bacterium]